MQSMGNYWINLLAATGLGLDLVNVRNEEGLVGRLLLGGLFTKDPALRNP